MESNRLVKLIGFSATLIHGDTLVADRWRWLRKRLPRTNDYPELADVGCGSGAFTIGAARRGYKALGISYDQRNQQVAAQRAAICHQPAAQFEICDVRHLDRVEQYKNRFDVAICLEVIEHILNDRKVLVDVAAILKPGGRLLLTAPYYHYRAIVESDNGPFCTTETGWHVRKGYTEADYRSLAADAGLVVEEISWCSGFLSQKITGVFWTVGRKSLMLAWLLVLPLRILPPLFDRLIAKMFRWPGYSICLVARKPQQL